MRIDSDFARLGYERIPIKGTRYLYQNRKTDVDIVYEPGVGFRKIGCAGTFTEDEMFLCYMLLKEVKNGTFSI